MKCDACGAPVENGVCTYCGKEFHEEPVKKGPEVKKTAPEKAKPQKVVVNVINQAPPVTKEVPKKKSFWRTLGIVLLWIYFFPIMLSYYIWKKGNMPKNQKLMLIGAIWALLLVIGGIGSCMSNDEETTSVSSVTQLAAETHFYDSAEIKDLRSGDGSNVIGTVSVVHANKADVTDEALQEWYSNLVAKENHNFCVIVYDDVPSKGVYATKSQVQKDVELVPDKDVYQVGSDRGSTFYSVDDNGQLNLYYSEPTEEDAQKIISQIDSFITPDFKGEGYVVEVGGDKNKLDANITLVNPSMNEDTYRNATAYLAGKVKENNLPIGYLNIVYQTDKYNVAALGSVDDATNYTGPDSVSVNIR